MRKRDFVILFCMMACFTGAIFLTIVYQEQQRKRTIANVDLICRQLESLTKMPCGLKAPPGGLGDSERKSMAAPIMNGLSFAGLRRRDGPVKPMCPADRPILGNKRNGKKTYHTPDSIFLSQVNPEDCFASVSEAEANGYRPPG